jgi:hypothetical protein
MAAGEVPGPLCSSKTLGAVHDGTGARMASPKPGSVGTDGPDLYTLTQELTALLRSDQSGAAHEARAADYRRRIQVQRHDQVWRKLRAMREIKREVWVTLDGPQRMDALREVHRIYAAAFGMVPSPISFEPLKNYGVYVASEKLLKVNSKLIVPEYAKPEVVVVELVCTVIHETRHYIQWRVIQRANAFPSFSPSTVKDWAVDYYVYIDPDKDYQRYRNKPIEADAFKVEDVARAMLYPDTLPTESYSD